jgi:hypothetical protein
LLTSIPDSVFDLVALKTLNLSENPHLSEISPKIGRLQRLVELRIKNLPSVTAVPCELHLCWRLEWLKAHHNPQLRKPVADGGLGEQESSFDFYWEVSEPSEFALRPLQKKWKRVYRRTRKVRWSVRYLFLALECNIRVVDAFLIAYPD